MWRKIMVRGVWLALVVGAAAAAGCASVIPYAPQEKLVDEIGVPEASARLQGVMTRAAAPLINSVNITDDFFLYSYQEQIHGPYGIPVGNVPQTRHLYFVNLDKLEIYNNNYVFIYAGSALRSQILFQTLDDAKIYADLIMSFRARKLRAPASPPSPAAPPVQPTPPPAQK